MQSKIGLPEIIRQLESCGYTCEAGPLENNTAFSALRSISESDCMSCVDADLKRQKELCKECRAEMADLKAATGAQVTNSLALKELLQISNNFFNEIAKLRIGNKPLKPAEIMFATDVIHDIASRWYQRNGR